MTVILYKNGVRKEVKVGFSWTTLFFGAWVPILRGMWPQVLIWFLSFGFAGLYYIFKINAIYGRRLIENGWEFSKDDVQIVGQEWKVWA